LPVGSEKNLDGMRLLVKSANAMGMLRDNRQITFLYLGDTALAMRVDADGTWNGQKSHVVLDWDYASRRPRRRHQRGRQVAADLGRGQRPRLDEKTPGVYGGAAKTSLQSASSSAT